MAHCITQVNNTMVNYSTTQVCTSLVLIVSSRNKGVGGFTFKFSATAASVF